MSLSSNLCHYKYNHRRSRRNSSININSSRFGVFITFSFLWTLLTYFHHDNHHHQSLSFFVSALPKLQQVHVITRHGARTRLSKNADTLTEASGSTLTPLGQKQLYDLGEWLRRTYFLEASEDPSIANTGFYHSMEFYNPSYHRLESSSLDRTLSSANSLSLGLFPLNAHGVGTNGIYPSYLPGMPSIPVYAKAEANDILIRAYSNCPTFLAKLQDLYQSATWQNLETNHRPLLEKLANKFPDFTSVNVDGVNYIPLRDAWNIYDPIHIARTECGFDANSYACTGLDKVDDDQNTYNSDYLLDALTDTEFQEFENLVEQAERVKYGTASAGNLLGSNLLWEILSRTSFKTSRFFLYSAHAPTILGFLSTLQEQVVDEMFVDYASAIIVEVYLDEDAVTNDQQQQPEYTIRFLYKKGSSNVARYLPLNHIGCSKDIQVDGADTGDTVVHCSLVRFIVWATENTIFEQSDWCEACENDFSDVCMENILRGNGAAAEKFRQGLIDLETDIENVLKEESENDPIALAGSFVGGLLVGFFIMAVCCSCVCRRNNKSGQDHAIVDNDSENKIEMTSPSENGHEPNTPELS